MATLPEVHGTGILPIVAALRSNREKYSRYLPEHLERYLTLEVEPADWYPTEDLVALLQVFAHVEVPDTELEERFQYFGAVSARRDIDGTQNAVRERFRTEHAGIWKGALKKGQDHAEVLRRAFGMHQLYYDRGEFRLERASERVVTATLHDFPARRELCHLTLGYAREIVSIVELPATIDMTACRAYGDECCLFTVSFRDDADVADLIGI